MTVKYCKRVWEFFAANVELEPKPSDQCTSDHVHVDDGYMNFDHDRGQRTSQVSRRLLKSLHFKTPNDGRLRRRRAMDQRGRELMRLSRLQHHLINILHLLLNQKMSLYVHNGWKYPLPMVLRPIHIGLPSMTILLTTIRDKNEYPRSIDETPRHVADSPANGTTPIEHYVRRVVTYLARVQSVTQSQQGLILRMYVKLDTKEWLKMHARLYNACELTSCFHLPDPVLLTAAVLVKDETDLVARDDVTDEMRTMTMRSINSLRNGLGLGGGGAP